MRFIRRLLLVLSLIILVLWGWSYGEVVDLPGYDTLHYPRVPRGGERFVHPRIERGTFNLRDCRVVPGAPLVGDYRSPGLGFRYQKVCDGRYAAGTFVERNYYVPGWFLLAVSLPYPVTWLARRVRRPSLRERRLRAGLCLQCGYDLRGNVSGTCPECGEKAVPCPP
jgi:hypothetical protein